MSTPPHTDWAAVEAHRAACMARMKALVEVLLYERDKVKRRQVFDAFLAQHGPHAAREARKVERAIRDGKKNLEDFQ